MSTMCGSRLAALSQLGSNFYPTPPDNTHLLVPISTHNVSICRPPSTPTHLHRHYCERVLSYAMGEQRARHCPALLRHQVRHKRALKGMPRLCLSDRLLIVGQHLTDVRAWPILQVASKTTAAALSLLAGKRLIRAAPMRSLGSQAPRLALPFAAKQQASSRALPFFWRAALWRQPIGTAQEAIGVPAKQVSLLAAAAAGAVRHMARRH